MESLIFWDLLRTLQCIYFFTRIFPFSFWSSMLKRTLSTQWTCTLARCWCPHLKKNTDLTAHIKIPPPRVDGQWTFHTVTGHNLRGLKQQSAVTADDVRAQTHWGFSFIKAINHGTTCHASEPWHSSTGILLTGAAPSVLMLYWSSEDGPSRAVKAEQWAAPPWDIHKINAYNQNINEY